MVRKRDPEIDDDLVDPIVAYLCKVGRRREIYFLWRPFLRDPADEMVLEVAVESGCDAIVTHNIRELDGVEGAFGIPVQRPREFLQDLLEEDETS